MSQHWSEHRERGSAFAIGLILWIARHLGRSAARLVLYLITGYFLITASSQRRASRDYLRRVLADLPGLPQIDDSDGRWSAPVSATIGLRF